jgi:thioredoxin 2
MPSEIVTCGSCGTANRVAPSASGAPHCAKCNAVLPWLVDVHDDLFTTVIGESTLPVLIDLWAPWFPPCCIVGPLVEASATRFAGRLKVA